MTQDVQHICTHCKQVVEVDSDILHHALVHDVPSGFQGTLDPHTPRQCIGSNRPTQRVVSSPVAVAV